VLVTVTGAEQTSAGVLFAALQLVALVTTNRLKFIIFGWYTRPSSWTMMMQTVLHIRSELSFRAHPE
jgi:hypothetical protein